MSTDLTEDDLFFLMRAGRRRRIIECIDIEGATTASDISWWIAAEENDTTIAEVGTDERTPVYVGLTQNHLPILERHDVIVYDEGSKDVEPGPTFEEVRDAIQLVVRSRADSRTSWHGRVLGNGGVADV